ncbi:MAG: hypothetical protein MUC96_23545, partial [Myxococcaceae bacterium]|nr:hypothetical protein [Myxococcaceae bacterium]
PLTTTRGYGERGGSALEFYVVTEIESVRIEPTRKRGLVRALVVAPTRREFRPALDSLRQRLKVVEAELWQQHRRSTATSADGDRVLPSVTPLLAALVIRE